MASIWKKSSFANNEEFHTDNYVKKHLTSELNRVIHCLQQENLDKAVITDNEESVNAFCSVLEAVFIHGLKDKLSTIVSAVFVSGIDKMPQPQFWTFVSNCSHKNVIVEINQLSQITTDIGRSRAWLRIALNDGLIVSYIRTLISDKNMLQKFYNSYAYLRDEEQSDIMMQLLDGISIFHFELSCNNSALNMWSSLPLSLANLWIPPEVPQPVMPAIDVIDYFIDQANVKKIKTSSPKMVKGFKSHKQLNPKISCSLGVEVSTETTSQVDYKASNSLDNKLSNPEINAEANLDLNIHSKTPESESDNCNVKSENDSPTKEFVLSELKNLEISNVIQTILEETSSKISSSDSIPDFGTEIEPLPDSMPIGSLGNRLNEKSGWSSLFECDDVSSKEKDYESDHSCDSSFCNYDKNIVGTPELTGAFSSRINSSEEDKNEDEDRISSPQSPELDFEIIPRFYSMTGADEETKRLLSIISKLCPQQGLDMQNFQCYACGRPLGFIYGKARLCYYDGYNYCYECHENEESFIPARIIHNWDFKQYPVSKGSKSFLSRIDKDPLFDIKVINPIIYTAIDEMAQMQLLRTQLTFLRSYIFTCKESIAEELRTRLWPREYLYEHVHLYSLDDLLEIPSGILAQTLTKIIAFARKHVMGCQLCLLKGFICEVCNNLKPIYPFDIDSTYHCEKCLSVYHATCMDANKYCPKCARRRKRQMKEVSST